MEKKNKKPLSAGVSNLVSSKQMDYIRVAKNNYEKQLFQREGITAVGIGLLKDDSGEYINDVGITIFYDPDNPAAVADIPPKVDGIRTQVRPWRLSSSLETESELAQAITDTGSLELEDLSANPRKQVTNPIIGGISASPDFFYLHPRRGTIGLIVRDIITGNALLMSTQSAIAGRNPQVDDGISQPARRGLGHRAAELAMWAKGDTLFYEESYYIDIALARPTNGRTAEIGWIYGINQPIAGTSHLWLNMEVIKSGVSGLTYGRVTNTDFTVANAEEPMSRMFVVESMHGTFSTKYDKGSAILTVENGEYRVVGLLNNIDDGLTLCSLITPILAYTECSVT